MQAKFNSREFNNCKNNLLYAKEHFTLRGFENMLCNALNNSDFNAYVRQLTGENKRIYPNCKDWHYIVAKVYNELGN